MINKDKVKVLVLNNGETLLGEVVNNSQDTITMRYILKFIEIEGKRDGVPSYSMLPLKYMNLCKSMEFKFTKSQLRHYDHTPIELDANISMMDKAYKVSKIITPNNNVVSLTTNPK